MEQAKYERMLIVNRQYLDGFQTDEEIEYLQEVNEPEMKERRQLLAKLRAELAELQSKVPY